MKLGDKIRTLRAEARMSLAALAERSKVSKGYLSQLERQEATNPSVDALRRIAEALEVDPSYLLETNAEDDSETARLPAGLREFIEEMSSRGEALPREDVHMLQGIKYRGRRPRTALDWAYLYETIKRVIR